MVKNHVHDEQECGDDLDAEASARAAALEADYPAERVKQLVENGGSEPA